MADRPPYCNVPRFFGSRFQAWFDQKFTANCHKHDQQYGSYTMITRWRADANLFGELWQKHKPLAVLTWIVVRVAIWKYKRNKLINGVAARAPWFYTL